MQKSAILLALFAVAAAQFQLPTFNFTGAASFGTSSTATLAAFTATSGSFTSQSYAVQYSTFGGNSFGAGFNASFTINSASGGSVTVNTVTYTAGSINNNGGFGPTSSFSGSAGAALQANFGFNVYTTIAGAFTITMTLTPTIAATIAPPAFGAQLQLFYATNATDGSGNSYSGQGASNTGFYGAVPSTAIYSSSNVFTGYTFTLQPVAYGQYTAANVNLAAGASGSTPAFLPVLYGTTAAVVAQATAVYAFSTAFAIKLTNAANATITAAVSTTYNASVDASITITAGASSTVATSGRAAGYIYNKTNTAFTGIAFDVNVTSQAALQSSLSYAANSVASANGYAVTGLRWAYYNASAGTTQILTDSVYTAASANAQATVTVGVNHYSTYALFQTNAAVDTSAGSTNTGTGSSNNTPTGSSPKSTGSIMYVAPAVLAVAAALVL